jgi:hypothetical protein
MAMKIYVGNLSFSVTNEGLEQLFSNTVLFEVRRLCRIVKRAAAEASVS